MEALTLNKCKRFLQCLQIRGWGNPGFNSELLPDLKHVLLKPHGM